MLYQTAIAVEGGGGNIHMCDTILYKSEPWLVLSWLKTPAGEPQRPMRIVRLAVFPHQVLPANFAYQYVIESPIPKALFDGGQLPTWLDGSVVDHPEVSIQIGSA